MSGPPKSMFYSGHSNTEIYDIRYRCWTNNEGWKPALTSDGQKVHEFTNEYQSSGNRKSFGGYCTSCIKILCRTRNKVYIVHYTIAAINTLVNSPSSPTSSGNDAAGIAQRLEIQQGSYGGDVRSYIRLMLSYTENATAANPIWQSRIIPIPTHFSGIDSYENKDRNLMYHFSFALGLSPTHNNQTLFLSYCDDENRLAFAWTYNDGVTWQHRIIKSSTRNPETGTFTENLGMVPSATQWNEMAWFPGGPHGVEEQALIIYGHGVYESYFSDPNFPVFQPKGTVFLDNICTSPHEFTEEMEH